MFAPRLALPAALAALLSTASAQISTGGLTILVPGGPNLWWVANSINTLTWTCHTTNFTNYTVLIGNSNPSVMTAPLPILSQENNFDCSKLLTPDLVTEAAGTGYFVQLANPFNETDIWAQSAEFEIKPVGAAYPASSATPTAASTAGAQASGSGSGSSGAASNTASTSASGSPSPAPSKSAAGSNVALPGLVAVAAAALGLALA